MLRLGGTPLRLPSHSIALPVSSSTWVWGAHTASAVIIFGLAHLPHLHVVFVGASELDSEPLKRVANERMLVNRDGRLAINAFGSLNDGRMELGTLGKSRGCPSEQLPCFPDLSARDHFQLGGPSVNPASLSSKRQIRRQEASRIRMAALIPA